MKIISIDQFDKIKDKINFNLLKEKNVCEDRINEKYSIIYSKYRYGLEIYVNHIWNIVKYDLELQNSQYMFDIVKEVDKDFYQRNSSLPLKYFYLRNNLYIERLSREDLQTIFELDESANIKQLLEIVIRTYKTVIAEFVEKDENVQISFGRYSDDISCFASNKTIVIGVRYDKFSNEETLKEKWEDNYFNQQDYLDQIIMSIYSDIKINEKENINIIYYNDFNY